MNKLGEFFQTRRSKRGLHKESVPFPPLSAEEQKEIKEKLGIEPTADLEATVRSTLRKIKQVEIEEVSNDPEDNNYEEIGTVRIRGMPDGDKFGTIRRKKKQEEEEEDWGSGTVRIYSDPQAFFSDDKVANDDKPEDAEAAEDQYGTMRIRHDSSDEDEEVEKKEIDKKNNRPKRKPISKRVKKNEPQFVYRLVTN